MTDLIESNSDPSDNTTPVSESSYVSPTISRLPSGQRPKPTTVCETCPAAIWHVGRDGIRNYCRTMHVIVWTKDDPNPLTACDGREMALAEMEAIEQGG